MASSESTEASTFDNGPLHIDYAAGYATKDGRELAHPNRVQIARPSGENVDKVLTHTFITREIWGTSWDSVIRRACACSCAPCARRSRQTPLTPR